LERHNYMRTRLSVRSLLLAAAMITIPVALSGEIILSIGIAPPPLPVYEQTLCPGDGYIWTPGYWAYADEGYFWVPGTWAMAPQPGYLWTPGYWGWGENAYVFHQGYWGEHVGFYGGINYGFGYVGNGYEGGYWNNGAFFYNRSVNNVGHVTNVYEKTVVNVTVERVSYNGGSGGLSARPTAEEVVVEHERHVAPTSAQTQHVQAASTNRQLYQSENHGKPAIAATSKPGEFSAGVTPAKEASESHEPARNETAAAASRPATAVHPKELPAVERPAPNTGNPQLDKKYQQQQAKLTTQQTQERQKLQQKQDQDHQRQAQAKSGAASQQQLEQKHQQQTQQLAQRHEGQQKKLEQKQPAAHKTAAPPAEQKKA
jgi:hypothetical protein